MGAAVPSAVGACGENERMLTLDKLIRGYDMQWPGDDSISTGLCALDELTGGFCPGQVWIVTGAPGQGRSMLLSQWAMMMAVEHGWRTRLVCPREDPHTLATRMIANLGRVALGRLATGRLDEEEFARTEEARRNLKDAQFDVASMGEAKRMDGLDALEPPQGMTFTVIDDADLVDADPSAVAAMAAGGGTIVLSLPRDHLVIDQPAQGDLDPAWARVADVVVDVRTRNFSGDPGGSRDGEAELTTLKHRRGPTGTARIAFEGFYARFRDFR